MYVIIITFTSLLNLEAHNVYTFMQLLLLLFLYRTLARNIRQRRGKKVVINVPSMYFFKKNKYIYVICSKAVEFLH